MNLRRPHPLTLLGGLVLLVVVALTSPWWWLTAGLLVAVLGAGLTRPPAVRRAMIISVGAVVVLSLLVQGLLVDLDTAARLAARLGLLVGAGVLIGAGLGPAELMAVAVRLRLGPRIGYVLASAVTALPALRDRAAMIIRGQQARGLQTRGGPVRRLRALVALTGPLLVGTLAENDERAAALESRGLGRTSTFVPYRVVPWPLGERVAALIMLVAAALIMVTALVGTR